MKKKHLHKNISKVQEQGVLQHMKRQTNKMYGTVAGSPRTHLTSALKSCFKTYEWKKKLQYVPICKLISNYMLIIVKYIHVYMYFISYSASGVTHPG